MDGHTELSFSLDNWYTVFMAKIPLFGKRGVGKFALVDDDEVENVAGIRWHVSPQGYAINRTRGKTTYMHRITNKTPDSFFTDHKNHDKLDNRKLNLRTVTHKENNANQSSTKGYGWDSFRQAWRVTYKAKYIGRYKTEDEAKRAYLLAKSGVPKQGNVHPRRRLLPKGVMYSLTQSRRGKNPFYTVFTRNRVKYFDGYFKTASEAEQAYHRLVGERR